MQYNRLKELFHNKSVKCHYIATFIPSPYVPPRQNKKIKITFRLSNITGIVYLKPKDNFSFWDLEFPL